MAAAQINFKPLDRGDYEEADEKLLLLRGMEVSGQYALRGTETRNRELSGKRTLTGVDQDFRLHLNTVFHRDVSLNLVLEILPGDLNEANIREEDNSQRNRLPQASSLTINPRAAYLRYLFNPNSPILLGKYELSLGDRKGKTFNAIIAGATFDCRAGTWCMPFGAAKIRDAGADWLYHWALEYTAWDGTAGGFPKKFQVEIFRIIYTEHNTPLGSNLGPTGYDPSDETVTNSTQFTDINGDALFYDAREHNYFGLRVNWEEGAYFTRFDLTSSQGRRKYHLNRSPGKRVTASPVFTTGPAKKIDAQGVAGSAVEIEAGYRWDTMRIGFRIMNATGDNQRSSATGASYRRALQGYYEITPGTYRGTRLYFNGGDSKISDGAGLGHSVNNTRVNGVFFDWVDPSGGKIKYSTGIYRLSRNAAIRNENGTKKFEIGTEWDNMVTWNIHKAVRIEFEFNGIIAGQAFSIDDYTVPVKNPDNYLQGIGRLVYTF